MILFLQMLLVVFLDFRDCIYFVMLEKSSFLLEAIFCTYMFILQKHPDLKKVRLAIIPYYLTTKYAWKYSLL